MLANDKANTQHSLNRIDGSVEPAWNDVKRIAAYDRIDRRGLAQGTRKDHRTQLILRVCSTSYGKR
jgi:hypothetical protein